MDLQNEIVRIAQQKTIPLSKWRALIQINHLMNETRAKNKELGNGDGYGDGLLSFAESNTDNSDLMKDLVQSMNCLEKKLTKN